MRDSKSISWIQLNHSSYYVLSIFAQLKWEIELSFKNQFMQIFQIRCFKGNCSAQHRIKENTQGPNVDEEAFIAFVDDDFRGEVGWGSALFLYDLTLFDYLTDTKITDLDSLLTIKQNIIQFDITMNNTSAMDMSQSISDLLKNEFSITFLESALSLYKSE